MKTEFTVPNDLPYYSDVGRYNEVKYYMYSGELRMEFYLEVIKLFCQAGESFLGIHCGAKCLLAAKVRSLIGNVAHITY